MMRRSPRLPSGEAMIPEMQVLRLHRWLALHEPIGSFRIAEDAGARTADYIIAHRIPRPPSGCCGTCLLWSLPRC